MNENEKPALGLYLRSLRDARGLTLREVEDSTGVSNAFLSQLESGKVKQPSPTVLYKLAHAYEVPYEALMERAGYPVPRTATNANSQAASVVFDRLGPITEDEEQALLDYLAFLRGRTKRKGGQR